MTTRTYLDEPAPGFTTSITVEDGEVRSIYVEALPGHQVSGTEMRKLRVHDLLTRSTSDMQRPVSDSDLEQVRSQRRRASNWSEVVRLLHSHALNTGRSPVQYVRDQLGLAPATATRWVRDACQ